MYCKKCGNALNDNDLFCTKCGEATGTEANNTTDSAATQPDTGITAVQNQQANSGVANGGNFDKEKAEKAAKLTCGIFGAIFGVIVICCLASNQTFLGLVFLIMGAIVIPVSYTSLKKKNEKMEQGIMVQRAGVFYEMEETFTTTADWKTVWGALREADYHGSISNGHQQQGLCVVDYKSTYFTARFSEMDNGTEDTHIYKFQFTHWKSRNGIPYSVDLMNVLLTTIEKTFLQIDPATQVSTKKVDFKTNTKFF